MYERMLDKEHKPSPEEINEYTGKKYEEILEKLFSGLNKVFDKKTEIKFPFGNNYGWGYKVSHKSKHLLYIFFEKRNNC